MTTPTQPLTFPNPWTDHPEPPADDATRRGHQVPEDVSGLQISIARYLNYLRERQAQTTKEVAA